MKRILFLFILLTGLGATAQDSARANPLSLLLTRYYELKDALVEGQATTVATRAQRFVEVTNTIDFKVISEGNINALLKDATLLSEDKDISKQRERFINLSENMARLAKTVKFGEAPVYQQYCPMKKASWLSSETVIRNPYYGSAMLSCGKVIETFR